MSCNRHTSESDVPWRYAQAIRNAEAVEALWLQEPPRGQWTATLGGWAVRERINLDAEKSEFAKSVILGGRRVDATPALGGRLPEDAPRSTFAFVFRNPRSAVAATVRRDHEFSWGLFGLGQGDVIVRTPHYTELRQLAQQLFPTGDWVAAVFPEVDPPPPMPWPIQLPGVTPVVVDTDSVSAK
jgi:hypothetical protein